MYDYSTYYGAQSQQMSTGTIIFYIAVFVVMLVSQWKIFTKAGKPGWACLVPFYNIYTLFEVAGMNGWYFLFLLIPLVNIFFGIKVYIDLAKAFGKGIGFALGLLFFSPIFLCILAFGSAEYVGKE